MFELGQGKYQTDPQASSGSFSHLAETTMSNPYLPSEILNHTVDLLHDERGTLKKCCLVSKSWVPRTRKHLFADVQFISASDLVSWKKMFPDIANSPGHYTQTLFFGCPRALTASDADEGGWIRAFSSLKGLNVDDRDGYPRGLRASDVSLAPFRKFSSTLKSLRVGIILLPYPGLFDFILSFPLLEDLGLAGHDDPSPNTKDPLGLHTVIPSTSPPFIGSLVFHIGGRAADVARQLLDLPSGLHFRWLTLLWDRETDISWIAELVVKCSRTLESLSISHSPGTFIHIRHHTDNSSLFQVGSAPGSLDLSKATRLRDLVFRPESRSAEWITMALRTITPEHQDFRRITIHIPFYLTFFGAGARQSLGETAFRQWLDLDRILVRIWDSRAIRPNVGCVRLGQRRESTKLCIGSLLPEITKRGIIDPL